MHECGAKLAVHSGMRHHQDKSWLDAPLNAAKVQRTVLLVMDLLYTAS
jgi:hypothetical protein